MTDELTSKGSPTIPEKSPTVKATGKKVSPTKKTNSPTVKQGSGLNKIKQDELVKWTVFVQPETRTSVNKAATKAGVTVTDWVDSRLRNAATAELTSKSKPPAKPEDLVADIVKQFADQMQANQAATLQAQNDLIQQQGAQIEQLTKVVEQVAAKPPVTFREMLFGKTNRPQDSD